MSPAGLDALVAEILGCRRCEAVLPHPPRPVLRVGAQASVLVIGQAPGRRVHVSGVPWDDPSGERLRDWLGVSPECFYDPRRFAIMGMGFCFPGTGLRGDLPPRPECALAWHAKLLQWLPQIRLVALVGRYSQTHYLGSSDVAGNVQRWGQWSAQGLFPLPHPSPRNRGWLKTRPWFTEEVVPALRRAVDGALAGEGAPLPLASAWGGNRQGQSRD
jgi:uracil-DNA glycosylase